MNFINKFTRKSPAATKQEPEAEPAATPAPAPVPSRPILYSKEGTQKKGLLKLGGLPFKWEKKYNDMRRRMQSPLVDTTTGVVMEFKPRDKYDESEKAASAKGLGYYMPLWNPVTEVTLKPKPQALWTDDDRDFHSPHGKTPLYDPTTGVTETKGTLSDEESKKYYAQEYKQEGGKKRKSRRRGRSKRRKSKKRKSKKRKPRKHKSKRRRGRSRRRSR